jgi:hypothetical protein
VDKRGVWANYLPDRGVVAIADDQMLPTLREDLAAAGMAKSFKMARDLGVPKSLVYANYTNFAPRLGVAWRPFGGRSFVVRTGYGIYFGSLVQNNLVSSLVNFPFTVTQTFTYLPANPAAMTIANPFPASRAVISGTTAATGYELRPPAQYLQSWNFTLERELGRMSAVEVGYIGSKGTHLPRQFDINQPLRKLELRVNGVFPRPNMDFVTINYVAFGSNSVYDAFSTTFRRRLTNNLFFRVNYIFSKSLDSASQAINAGTGGYAGAQDSRNLGLERGRSDFDIRSYFTYSFNYETPRHWTPLLRGWQFSGTGIAASGAAFTPNVSAALVEQGEATRPDRLSHGKLDNPSPARWFDLAAFSPVARNSYRFGNSGRNILSGPGNMSANLALMKRFYFKERRYLQFRCEAYNFVNHANFNLPVKSVDTLTAGTLISARPARTMQLALNLVF